MDYRAIQRRAVLIIKTGKQIEVTDEKLLGRWRIIQSAKREPVEKKCQRQPEKAENERENDASHPDQRKENCKKLVGQCMV